MFIMKPAKLYLKKYAKLYIKKNKIALFINKSWVGPLSCLS